MRTTVCSKPPNFLKNSQPNRFKKRVSYQNYAFGKNKKMETIKDFNAIFQSNSSPEDVMNWIIKQVKQRDVFHQSNRVLNRKLVGVSFRRDGREDYERIAIDHSGVRSIDTPQCRVYKGSDNRYAVIIENDGCKPHVFMQTVKEGWIFAYAKDRILFSPFSRKHFESQLFDEIGLNGKSLHDQLLESINFVFDESVGNVYRTPLRMRGGFGILRTVGNAIAKVRGLNAG
jgi:hypothetical protein